MRRRERETDFGRIRGVSHELIQSARQLRKEMTPAERLLWERLRSLRLNGLKFRRQHTLGPFIVDFCCPDSRLVIEVDSDIHDEQIAYDAARTEYLNQYHYDVIRFRNEAVLRNLDAVLEQISAIALARQGIRHELSMRKRDA